MLLVQKSNPPNPVCVFVTGHPNWVLASLSDKLVVIQRKRFALKAWVETLGPSNPVLPLRGPAPDSSHHRVAGQVGDAAQVAAVTGHQDVALLAPALAPAYRGERERERGSWNKPHPGGNEQGRVVWHPPVLDDPVGLLPGAHTVAHQQHGMVDVFTVALRVVVNTWTGDGGGRGGADQLLVESGASGLSETTFCQKKPHCHQHCRIFIETTRWACFSMLVSKNINKWNKIKKANPNTGSTRHVA